MIQEIKAEITAKRNSPTDYWFCNETFNKLLKEANNVRITNEGALELCFEGEIIGVVTDAFVGCCEGIAYVKVVYFNDVYRIDNGTRLSKKLSLIL